MWTAVNDGRDNNQSHQKKQIEFYKHEISAVVNGTSAVIYSRLSSDSLGFVGVGEMERSARMMLMPCLSAKAGTDRGRQADS